MTNHITSSSELRGFVADNTGRRKIDTEASLELHIRAATQIDLLTQELTEAEQRVADAATRASAPAPAPAPAPATSEDPSASAMMLLRNAQIAADETLTEAAEMRAKAAATLADAEATAQARAETAIADALARADKAAADAQYAADQAVAEARARADRVIADAQAEAGTIVQNAHLEAESIAGANQKVRDRAEFIQRQYLDKAGIVRREAEALADFSRQVETFAKSDMVLPPFDPDAVPARASSADEDPAVTPSPAAVAPPPAPVAEPEPPAPVAEHVAEPETVFDRAPSHDERLPEPVAADSHLALVDDAPQAVLPPPPPPPPPAVVETETHVAAHAPEPPAAATQFLPPPPSADVLDLTEDELADVLEGRSIDDELFDDDVIDLTDGADETSDNFQFFGRD